MAAAHSNARLYDDSFEQLLARTDLPQFDSISLHGIWTWVSRDNHRFIAEFARRHLKPGGVFYVSYNCFPGWSPAYPLRQLFALHDRFGVAPHGASARVDAALQFSNLRAQPASYKGQPTLEKSVSLSNIALIEEEPLVPILATFFGIIVRMWHDDHPPPHIHAAYQGFEALIDIRTGTITEGRLPNKAASIVKEWCQRHQDELMANWERAQKFEPLERIPGADQDA